MKFRTLLFKLFIIPHFDYCSSLFIYLKKNGDRERLKRCFNKCVYRLLNINIFSLTEFEQFELLFTNFRIFPLIYRQLYHFLCFIYKLIMRKNCKLYNKFLISKSITRNFYALPEFKTNTKKYSFIVISSKMLRFARYIQILSISGAFVLVSIFNQRLY